MDWFWRLLSVVIIAMLLVRCDIDGDLYKSENNNVFLSFPSFLTTPMVTMNKRLGEPFEWHFNAPWASDYEWQWELPKKTIH